ncbi:unnamed protein product [Paramecium octaurelia]|uniref:RRM domain-containing protein n=1 Tax=Paramecium octaurelia TaxID=43137 RepID=A0A8S1YDK4_PAROT|nr:unnamed protein product [Paramecium octaurelia]
MSTKKTQKVIGKTQKIVEKQSQESSNKEQKIKSKVNRLEQQPQERQNGIIYVGHLPYGFVEDGLKEYFTQFGDVLGVKIFRSKKTNRVQGYGFVKFADKEVAPIAAQAMNGYLMNGKKLVVNVLSDQHPDPFKYKHGNQKLHFINWSEKAVEESNKEKSNEQIVKEVERLLSNEEEKRQKLKELGINYTYQGFKELLKA